MSTHAKGFEVGEIRATVMMMIIYVNRLCFKAFQGNDDGNVSAAFSVSLKSFTCVLFNFQIIQYFVLNQSSPL